MALDPFAKLGTQFQQKGYDPLAIMAGLGVGRRRAGELQAERQQREAEASRQAAELQMRARQMEQEAAAQAARREFEMKQLGMTELQQRQAAEMQQKQLDRQIAESQANEAYRQAALAQAPQLAAQQAAAQAEQARLARLDAAEQARLTREAAATESGKAREASRQERIMSLLGTLGSAGKLTPDVISKARGGKLDVADLLGVAATQPMIPAETLASLVRPREVTVPATDAEGKPIIDPETGAVVTIKQTVAKSPQDIATELEFFRRVGYRVPDLSDLVRGAGRTAGTATRGAGGGGLAALMSVLEKQAEDRRRIEARRGAK